MSSRSQISSYVPTALLVLLALATFVALAAAQDNDLDNSRTYTKWELFGGYSFFYPHADVHGVLPGGLLPVTSFLESDPRGAGASVTYNLNHWLGLTADMSGHWDSNESGAAQRIDDAAFYNISGGPKITWRTRHFSPFMEALVGGHRLTPDLFKHDDHFGFMAGGGIDVGLSRHFALRLIRADYVFSNHRFGPESVVPTTEVRGARLQSGLVIMFGAHDTALPTEATCAVNPSEVFAGEPVNAITTTSNFNSSHSLNYSWSSTGGKVTGKDNSATIDTNGVAGGKYMVSARVSDPRMKNRAEASCNAAFSVKDRPQNPPTVSCQASPPTLFADTQSIVTCTCTSPDNAPVNVANWTATGGNIIPSDNGTAVLKTSGATPGPIIVRVTCSDARGLNTQAMTEITVESLPAVSPEIARLETRLALHSIYFATAHPTVADPNHGLLPSQQQTLRSLADDFKKYLQLKPDAHLTLEGHADPRASVEYNQALSERRVERTKQFLIESGVPEPNIETRAFGKQQTLSEAEVRNAVEQNPELSPTDRQRVLRHMTEIMLASNRRVDVTLSTTGQQSVRQFPFNAADALTLLK